MAENNLGKINKFFRNFKFRVRIDYGKVLFFLSPSWPKNKRSMKNNGPYKIALAFSLITLIVYGLSYRGEGANWNYFVLLADAFLHGRLYLTEGFPWLNELVKINNFYYVVFPPMPAILLVPFVAVFGISFPQPYLSIFLGAINVGLAYFVFKKVFGNQVARWTSILYAFGTIQWYHSEVGSAWYLAHISALFFMWLALLETVTKKRLFLIGLLIGGAYLSRLPTLFMIVFVLLFLHRKFGRVAKNHKIQVFYRNFFKIGLGILPAVAVQGAYNYVRYGVFYDRGYTLLPILDEPWYRHGFLSIKYIPIHLKEMFLSAPHFIDEPPFIIPSLFAMSILLITPAFLLVLRARFRQKISLASLASILFIALPILLHGGNGFTQFGYRHTLDFLPFMLILVASGLERRIDLLAKILVILSILVNLWGVVMISGLGIWKM